MEKTEGSRKIKFSFSQYFAKQKQIGYPALFNYKLSEENQAKWNIFNKWIDQNGVYHEKIAYPAIFSARKGIEYMGMIALENINENEIIVKVPSKIIISTKVAYYSDLNAIFKKSPSIFAPKENPRYWEDFILISFILYEKQKGEKSFWFPYLNILPEKCDCLLNWDDEEIDEVQDKILIDDAQKEFEEISTCWNKFYNCLSKYPMFFKQETISFSQFKWAYILIYTRLFSIFAI